MMPIPLPDLPDITDTPPGPTITTTTPPPSSSSATNTNTPSAVGVATPVAAPSTPAATTTPSGNTLGFVSGLNWKKLLAIALLIGLLLAVSQWKLGARFAQLSIVLVIVGVMLGYANANGGQSFKQDLANFQSMFSGPVVS